MSRRFTRLSLLSVLLLTSEIWAIGLGDINLDSALNEPLRAEIVLLSASSEELTDLTVTLASAETFARYGIDRPFYLQNIEFNVVGGAQNIVQIRSRSPITEPFLTFLVEANWSSGKLLREYTILLDPPTYAAPTAQQAPSVQAPVRSTPSDSGRIEREQPPRQTRPSPEPARSSTNQSPPEPRPEPVVDNSPYGTADGGDVIVNRGDTLWGVASRSRSDSRLTMNQTMLAIYEANRDSFGGNINVLRAGAALRIPSADEVFQISRGDASNEVQRQHSDWGGGSGYIAPEQSTGPSLVLVPPDEDPVGGDYSDDSSTYEPQTREQEIESRISELETANVPNQKSLIDIRDNELATLRQELANIRGEVYEPPVEDVIDDPVDDVMVDDTGAEDPFLDVQADDSADTGIDDVMSDDTTGADDVTAVDDTADETPLPANDVVTSRSSDDGIVDKILDFLVKYGLFLLVGFFAIGAIIWFLRRSGDDDDDYSTDRPWESLDGDGDESLVGEIAATASMHAPVAEETIVVVEQDSGVHPIIDETIETPTADIGAPDETSGAFGSLEDTFSSETAVNLDQTDPIAEADFHMAYGLYDQAADLVNGALESDPSDRGLMSKLCEIYFVWGNRDSFVDAATRLKALVGGESSAEWDKIVIMGQQIAADHDLFAGAELAGAAKAVDLSFDEGDEAAGALDMDFGAEDSGASDVIDLGADGGMGANDETHQGVDFNFDDVADQSSVDLDLDLDVTAQSPTIDATMTEATAEMPTPTVESSTFDEPFADFGDGTSELPSLDETSLSQAIFDSGQDADATAEINLDDLDLDIGGMAETEIASLDDLDETSQNEALSETGVNEALVDLDLSEITGRNPEIDPDATGVQEALDTSATGLVEGLDLSELDDIGMGLAADETGQNPQFSAELEQDPLDVDDDLLDATGHTQVLSGDMAVDTVGDLGSSLANEEATMLASMDEDEGTEVLPADAETMLAPLDDDGEFDFAKTEALPPEAFSGGTDLEATAETPAVAETDFDLDLDDLTAALQVSEIGDTVAQPRDEATVEQPRPEMSEETSEVPTMALAPEDMSTDLHDARTMTEVGTKLDLARAYVDMGDPAGARSILEEVLDEGDDGQKQQAQKLLDSLPS